MTNILLIAYRNLRDYSNLFSSLIKQRWFHDYDGGNQDTAEVEHENCLEDAPDDITKGIIFASLSLSDRIRVGCVSKSCRARIQGVPPVPELPWLLLPRGDLNDKQLSFFDMSKGKVHYYNLPSSLQGCNLCGSSKGWLVFTKKRTSLSCYINCFNFFGVAKGELQIFLFNPISKSVHQLPSLPAPYAYFELFCQLTLVQLSSHDLRECMVATVIDYGLIDDPKLALCRPGLDKEWSILDGQENHHYVDTLFWNGGLCVLRGRTSEVEGPEKLNFKLGGGCEVNIYMIPCDRSEPAQFYFGDDHGNDNPDIDVGVDDENGAGIDELNFDIGVDDENGAGIDELNFDIGIDEEDYDYIWVARNFLKDLYLVESTSGELLMIVKISDEFMNSAQLNNDNFEEASDEIWDYVCRKTSGFEVYQMDPNGSEFRRVDDIGDQVIFLTLFGSQSCSGRDFELEGIRGNCIYFVEDTKHIGHEGSIAIASRESGVYHLDERKIERSLPNVDSITEDLMSWFTPYL